MQLTLFSVAAAMVATVSAYGSIEAVANRDAVTLNKECDKTQPHASIINRCDYDVHIWSVLKGDGCNPDKMVTLKKGEMYAENYVNASATLDGRGVSIKISKTEQCKPNDITQLEYFMDDVNKETKYQMNYLDVSYVDCLGGDCPTKSEGYYLEVGNKNARAQKLTLDASWCPILSCHDPISCAAMSYILPDDTRTKTCDFTSNMKFYLCGSDAPSDDDEKPSYPAPKPEAPKPEAPKPEAPKPEPSTTAQAPSSSANDYKVDLPAITPPAELKDAPKEPKVKTKTVVVTAYEYVNAKRSEHVHRHARRHQNFRA
jgi:hypothetical protein